MSRRRFVSDPGRGVAYVRVSTDEQHLGVEAQRAAIVAWGNVQKVVVDPFHEDIGLSGAAAIEARPGLLAALHDLRETRAGFLVVARRDRIARDVVVAAMVERAAAKCGALVASADGTGNGSSPADAFMRTVIDGAAAYERALIRARTKAALAAKRDRGERVGGVPFGYRLGDDAVRVVEDEHEQATLRLARTLRSDGFTLRAIRAELTARGVLSRNGRPFGLARVHAMTLAGQ